MFLSFLIPALFLSFLQVQPYLRMKFFPETFFTNYVTLLNHGYIMYTNLAVGTLVLLPLAVHAYEVSLYYVIVNVCPCTRYRKYHERIMMRAPEGRSPENAIIIHEGYSRNAYTTKDQRIYYSGTPQDEL